MPLFALRALLLFILLGAVLGETLHKIIILGATGTGKSTLAGTLATYLGYTRDSPFKTSDEIHAHTQAPISLIVGDMKITDTPGLMDTAGLDKDMRNMQLIVKSVCFLRRL